MKHLIDKILKFTISKKLTVFLIATILIFQAKLTGEQWINLSLMYIGTQGLIDLIIKLRK